MTTDGPQRSHLMELPMELHICIRNQLLRDPNLTVNDLRSLRLVCKTFNDIWSPVVMTNMVLFRTGLTNDALAQLRHIVHGKRNASTSAAYATLTIQHLYCLDTEGGRWYSDRRRHRERGITTVLARLLIATLFWSIAVVPLLIYSVLTIYPILLGIRCLAKLLVESINDIKRAMPKFRARYYMSLLPRKLNMRYIRRARLFLDYDCSDWAIYCSTRILLSLPRFTQLELDVANNTDLRYLVRCLKPLKRLHRLTLLPKRITPSQFQCIATLISNSENLTHLDWRSTESDLSMLFCDVPTTKPLKLRHLSLSHGSTTNFDALIPHIRSLTSVEFGPMEGNLWCMPFSQAKIFPSTIKVGLLDQALITFISGHPGLVSLKIVHQSWINSGAELVSSLCKTLTHHSETLQRLFFSHPIVTSIFYNEENKAKFLQFTSNLREFVLEIKGFYSEDKLRILSVVAHASHSLTVIIRTGDKATFSLCVAFCRDSENPLIRDLAGRIVYERA